MSAELIERISRLQDEITRLRAECERLRREAVFQKAAGEGVASLLLDVQQENTRLRAECERKDEALREIADCRMTDPWILTAGLMQDIARAALTPPADDPRPSPEAG